MKRDISKRKLLPFAIESVWQHLTIPDKLGWLGEAEIELRETGKIKIQIDKKSCEGEILTVQEPINLAYSWNDPRHTYTTYVWFKLMNKQGGTFLELEHSGFRGIAGFFASFSYGSFWGKKFKMLEKALIEANRVDS